MLDVLCDMKIVQTYVGIRKACPREIHIEVCAIAAQVFHLAPRIIGEVVLEVLYQLPFLPVGDDVEKFPRLSVRQIGDELDPLCLFAESLFDLRKCFIQAEDFRQMVRQRRHKVFQDGIDEVDGYAVVLCYCLFRHEGV